MIDDNGEQPVQDLNVVIVRAMQDFLQRLPVISREQYAEFVYRGMYPLTPFFKDERFEKEWEEFTDRKKKEYEQRRRNMEDQRNEPLPVDMQRKLAFQVDNDMANEGFKIISACFARNNIGGKQ